MTMQPPRTFRVMLRMQIRPGMEGDFEKTWYEVGSTVTEHPANIGQWLARSQDEAGVYYIISDWVDEPRFREFERSNGHVLHRQKLHPYRDAGSMTTMDVIYAMPGAGAS